MTLSSLHTHPTPGMWRNRLFHCDNLLAMDALASLTLPETPPEEGQKSVTPGIRFIYADPPFAVGADFYARLSPANQARGKHSPRPEKDRVFAYSDVWEGGIPDYLDMLRPRLARMRELLTPDGCLCVHCDWRAAHHIRLLLDTCFGPKRFLNEIIWHYTGGGRSRSYFSRKHDTLLLYAKGSRHLFNPDPVRRPYKPTSGYAKNGITSKAGKHYRPHPDGTPPDDVWDIPIVNPMAAERLGYATQKPEALLERLMLALTNPGDLIADFFCGSGTTLAVAQRLGRRWIGCDNGDAAMRITRRRLGEDTFVLHVPEEKRE